MECPNCGLDCTRNTFDTAPPSYGSWTCECGWSEEQFVTFKASTQKTVVLYPSDRRVVTLIHPDGSPLSAGELKVDQTVELDHDTGVIKP